MLEFRVFSNSIYTLGTALKAGLFLLPGPIIMGFINPITGYLFDKFGGKWLARISSLVLVLSTLPFTVLIAHTSFTYLAIANTVRMISLAMVIMPMTTSAINLVTQPFDCTWHSFE